MVTKGRTEAGDCRFEHGAFFPGGDEFFVEIFGVILAIGSEEFLETLGVTSELGGLDGGISFRLRILQRGL